MAVTAKKLTQVALSTSVTSRYTVPTSKVSFVSEIYLANNGSTDRKVSIYAHGTASTNLLMIVPVPSGGSVLIQDIKIVLAALEVLAAAQDAGTDVILTAYGIEEG